MTITLLQYNTNFQSDLLIDKSGKTIGIRETFLHPFYRVDYYPIMRKHTKKQIQSWFERAEQEATK